MGGGSSSSSSSSSSSESYTTSNLNVQAGGTADAFGQIGGEMNVESLDDNVVEGALSSAEKISAASLFYMDKMGTTFAGVADKYLDAIKTGSVEKAGETEDTTFQTLMVIGGVGAAAYYLFKNKKRLF